MIPLHRDSHFTFRFGDDRIIPRFHLEGVAEGTHVRVYHYDARTETQHGLITSAVVGAEGWVDLSEPLIVHTGEGFVVVPETREP